MATNIDLDSQIRNLHKRIDRVMEGVVEEVARAFVQTLSTPVLGGYGASPVWTGMFVDGWRVGINSPDLSAPTPGDYYQKASDRMAGGAFPIPPRPAQNIGANTGKISGFSLGDTIFITNNTTYYDLQSGAVTYTARQVEDEGTKTAPQGVTQPAADKVMATVPTMIKRRIMQDFKRGLL